VALTLRGNFPEAEKQFTRALKLQPESPTIHCHLGDALLGQNNFPGAAAEYSETLRLQPDNLEANFNLAFVLAKLGRAVEAVQYYHVVLRLKPQSVLALQQLAWLLATHPDPQIRDATEAIQLATQATQLAPADPAVWDAQAAALADSGKFPEAAAAAGKALDLATAGKKDLAKEIEGRLRLYQSGAPFHEPIPK
jgi:Flp pilus assembly protein TadD